MRLYLVLAARSIVLLFLIAIISPQAQAQTTVDQVQGALDALHNWLSSSDNGDGWKSYLQSEDLQQQLKKGRAANAEEVQKILALYKANNPGLTKERFQAVRTSLESWVNELELPSPDALKELAAELAEQVKPVEETRLVDARQNLDRALINLNGFLQGGGEEKHAAWQDFLRWQDMQQALEGEQPDLKTLTEVWAIYCQDAEALQLSSFAAVRQALRQYLDVANFFANKDEALDRLPAALEGFQKKSDADNKARLGTLVGWLQRTGQGTELVRALRYHYRRPNLFLQATEPLVIVGFKDEIDETQPVNDYVDGSSISGTSRTTGVLRGDLVPNHQAGEVQVLMEGVINSKTQAFNSGVTVSTTGVTQVSANMPVFFVGAQFRSGRAEARCTTDNTVTDISSSSSYAYSIAQQRVRDNEQSNEYRAARRSEGRVKSQLSNRVNKQLIEANNQMASDFFLPLSRRASSPSSLQYRSTDEMLFGAMVQATPSQLGASSSPPEFDSPGDLKVQLHESWFENLGGSAAIGAMLTDVDLAETIKEWRGEVPEQLRVGPDTDPWNFTFVTQRPVIFKVIEGGFGVTLRGSQFTARRRVMNEPMNISAVYDIQKNGNGVKLVRRGDVKIEFPDQGDRLPARYIALRKFWQSKFEGMFQSEYNDMGLELRGAWEKAGRLTLTDMASSDDGWLSLAYKMPEKNEPEDKEPATE